MEDRGIYTERDGSRMKTSTGTEFCCCDPQDAWGYQKVERGKDGLPYRFKGEHGPGGALRVWCSVMSPDCSLPHAPGLLCPWDFPGKNTGVGCRFLLQGIFWTQESNS